MLSNNSNQLYALHNRKRVDHDLKFLNEKVHLRSRTFFEIKYEFSTESYPLNIQYYIVLKMKFIDKLNRNIRTVNEHCSSNRSH